jgi:1-acyl-sn-glycerol-3-phosphate acyltransferase
MLWMCGARIRAVKGLEHLKPGQNYVFVSNHESLIDTPLLVAALPRALCFLAKKELFSIPFMGWYLRRAGHVPIERGDPRSTLRSLTEAARVIAEEHKSPLVFPEGTRSMDGELQEFKEGAALLAIRSGTPVAPVAVVGTRHILKAKGMAIRGGWIELRIGAPIGVEGMEQKRRGELTARIRGEIERLRRE